MTECVYLINRERERSAEETVNGKKLQVHDKSEKEIEKQRERERER